MTDQDRTIAELQRAIADLQASQARAESLIEKMPHGFALHEIICDDAGKPCDYRFIQVNEGFEELVGITADQVVGRTVLEVLPKTESYWIETYGRVALTGEPTCLREYSRNLERYYDAVAFCPELGQFAVVFFDATDRVRAEEALRLTQFSVDRAADAVFWMGPDARFVYVNDRACAALGYSRQELLSMTVHDIDPEFPPETWPDHWVDMRQRGSFTLESRHRTKDGRTFPVEIQVNHMAFEGKEYSCAFARDISERKEAEEKREQLIAQLESALAEVKRLSGLLPICSGCKKIRNDDGYWEQIETYIGEHSEAQFSHGVCPECAEKLYPQYSEGEEGEGTG